MMTTKNVALHQVVCTMANNAAQLLDQGHYSMAARELTAALSVNKHALSSISSSPNDASKPSSFATTSKLRTSGPSDSPSLLRQVCMAASSKWCTASDDTYGITGDSATKNFICCNTLYVPTDYQFPESRPLETHVALSIVILFNLALCYHLAAMNQNDDEGGNKEGNSSTTVIPRSEALYKACSLYTLHYRMLAEDNEQDYDTKMMLLLASINNLGHVKTLLGEESAANECFQWMLNTLLLLVTSRQWVQRNNNVSLEGFFQNLAHLVLTASHTACAA